MRENRLAKLAGLKKMAEVKMSDSVAKKTNFNISQIASPGYFRDMNDNILYYNGKSWFLAAKGDTKEFTSNDIDGYPPVGDKEYELVSIRNLNMNDLTSLKYKNPGAAPTTPATSTSTSRTSGPQATTAPIKPTTIIHAVGTKLKDDSYEYEVMDQEKSFEWIDLNNRSKHGTFSLSQSGTPKWNKAVAALNALTPQTSPVAAAPVAAAVTPAAAPAATTATTTQETSFDPALVSNVSIILSNASNKAYAPFSPGNQQQQLTTMFRAIDSAARRSGIEGVINPSQFLAKIIIAQSGPESLAGIGKIPSISSLRQGQIKRQAGQEVARLMSEVNKTYESYGGDDFKRMLISFSSKMKKVEASPSATAPSPTPAASASSPAADDGLNKKDASLNKKFIKAATLRRLKIRSQMEAAIDSSAQMGRARVS